MLDLAERMLSNDRLPDAYRYVMIAESIGKSDSGLLGKVKQAASEVKSAAEKKLDEAEQFYENEQYTEAIEAYSSISGLRKLDVARDARLKLAEIQRNPAVRASMREIRACQRLEDVLEMIDISNMDIEVVDDSELETCSSNEALPSLAVGDQGNDSHEYSIFGSESAQPDHTQVSASNTQSGSSHDYAAFPSAAAFASAAPNPAESVETMEDLGLSEVEVALLLIICDRIKFLDKLEAVADSYSDTKSGQRARDLANDLRACDAFMDGLEFHRTEEQAMEYISMAQQYEQIGKKDLAIKFYKDAILTCPDSEWSKAAQDGIDQLEN